MKRLLHLGMVVCLFFGAQQSWAQCATDLIISEYVEGTSFNKYIEIYNGTGAAVNLANYSVEIYSNGAGSAVFTINLSGTLADGSTYVIANNQATAFTGTIDLSTGSLSYNGDDALALLNSGTAIDVMGTIGVQASYGTNITLQRQSSITTPTATYNSSEWTTLPTDDVSGLGSHSITCGGPPCTTPNSDAGVTLTPFLEAMQIDITPPTGGADAYFVVIKTTNSITPPTNGTPYSVGSTYDGGTVVGFSSLTTFLASGLTPSTTYYVFVFSYNSIACTGGPSYASAVSPTPTVATLTSNPTTLQPGDFNIIGFDTYTGSGGADKLVLTNFVDLGPGTTFIIGNLVYEFKAAAGERTDRWYNGNGGLTNPPAILNVTYGGPTLAAGSVICLEITSVGTIGTVTVSGIDVSNRFTDDSGGLSFVRFSSSDPDAVFIMQGTFTNGLVDGDGDQYGTLDATGRVLGGIQARGDFQSFDVAGNAGGSRISRVHPDIECFAISTGPGVGTTGYFGYYDVTSEITTGTQHELLKSFADFTNNWASGTTTAVFPGDGDDIGGVICAPAVFITVTALAESGNWIGDTDRDWFNCLNWDKLEVPDENTDVTLGADAQADCEVDISVFSTNAAKFDNIAQCNDLVISSASFKMEVSSATEDTLIVNGDLTMEEGPNATSDDGGELDMSASGGTSGGTLILKGDWTDNNLPNNLFREGTASKVLLNGTVNQTLTVAATASNPAESESFANLEIDNAAGVSLAGRVEVEQDLEFTDGILTSATGNANGGNIASIANILVIADDATVTGASDASHVDGVVAKLGDENFTFPVGDGSFLREATLSGGAGTTTNDEFRVEFFSIDPDGPFVASNMNGVTNTEFWNIERMSGTSATKAITLTWDQSKTSDVNDPSVVRLNENPGTDFWELAGGNGKASSSGAGTVVLCLPLRSLISVPLPLPMPILFPSNSCISKDKGGKKAFS